MGVGGGGLEPLRKREDQRDQGYLTSPSFFKLLLLGALRLLPHFKNVLGEQKVSESSYFLWECVLVQLVS